MTEFPLVKFIFFLTFPHYFSTKTIGHAVLSSTVFPYMGFRLKPEIAKQKPPAGSGHYSTLRTLSVFVVRLNREIVAILN
jgi:hypothetical protein